MEEKSEIEKIHMALGYLSEQIDRLSHNVTALMHVIHFHNERLIEIERGECSPKKAMDQSMISLN